jgi:hypothetical protein
VAGTELPIHYPILNLMLILTNRKKCIGKKIWRAECPSLANKLDKDSCRQQSCNKVETCTTDSVCIHFSSFDLKMKKNQLELSRPSWAVCTLTLQRSHKCTFC